MSKPNAKLTIDQVRAIRASSKPHTVLAKEYGVTLTTIMHIRNFITWRDVK